MRKQEPKPPTSPKSHRPRAPIPSNPDRPTILEAVTFSYATRPIIHAVRPSSLPDEFEPSTIAASLVERGVDIDSLPHTLCGWPIEKARDELFDPNADDSCGRCRHVVGGMDKRNPNWEG